MARAILVAYDPETHDHAPIHFGIAMAAVTRTRLIIASVEAEDERAVDCAATLRELEVELQALDTEWECIRLTGRSAAGVLDQAARERAAGLLVVGSTRRGPAGRLLPGSTAERLLHGAPCPLAVTPREWTRGDDVETVGVACLDTRDGQEALRGAHALAGRAGARLRVVTVIQVTPTMYLETEAQTSGQRAKTFLDVLGERQLSAVRSAEQAVQELPGDVEVEIDGFIGDPAEVLIDVSGNLDALVMGGRAYGPLGAVLLGGVSRRVVVGASCPVIVLPRGVEAALQELLTEAPGAAAPV